MAKESSYTNSTTLSKAQMNLYLLAVMTTTKSDGVLVRAADAQFAKFACLSLLAVAAIAMVAAYALQFTSDPKQLKKRGL